MSNLLWNLIPKLYTLNETNILLTNQILAWAILVFININSKYYLVKTGGNILRYYVIMINKIDILA